MPIYEFYCIKCKNRQEDVFIGFEASPTSVICDICGEPANRIPSTFAMHFSTPAEKKAKEKGLVRNEPGMDKQARENKKHHYEKFKKETRKIVEDTVMQFDIPA